MNQPTHNQRNTQPTQRTNLVPKQRNKQTITDRHQKHNNLQQTHTQNKQNNKTHQPIHRAHDLQQLQLRHTDVQNLKKHNTQPHLKRNRPHVATHLLQPNYLHKHQHLPNLLTRPRPNNRSRRRDRGRNNQPQTLPPPNNPKRRRIEHLTPDDEPALKPKTPIHPHTHNRRKHPHPNQHPHNQLPTNHTPAPCQPRTPNLPHPINQHHPTNPHTKQRPHLTPDHVLPIHPRRPLKPRHRATNRGRGPTKNHNNNKKQQRNAIRRQPRSKTASTQDPTAQTTKHPNNVTRRTGRRPGRNKHHRHAIDNNTTIGSERNDRN